MKLDYQKELVPVLYGESAVKILNENFTSKNSLCFALHWHERMELLLINSGSLQLNIGDKEFTVTENHLVIIPPEYPHMGKAGQNGVSYHAIMFDIAMFYNFTKASEKYLKSIVEQKIGFLPFTDDAEILRLSRSIIDEQILKPTDSSLIIIGKIYELLGLLYRSCLSESTLTTPDSKFKNVLDFIEDNFCENISSTNLSRHFGYDESYFCRRFKSVTGLTPMNYINILRLEKAQTKIKEGKLKISEISELCGFKDAGYFTKCFKKRFGITPVQYADSNEIPL